MKKAFVCLLAATLALLSGCGRGLPQSRELDDMALMRTLGVDLGKEEGELLVTASTNRRARGLQGEAQPPLVLSAQRPSISGACLAIQGLSDSYVFYGHVDQLLLGEELARKEGVMEALTYFSQDESLGLGAQGWLIRGSTAQDAMKGGKDTGVDDRLSTIQEDEQIGAAGLTRTVGEALTDLLEQGSTYLPALRRAEQEESDTVLLEAGYGVLKDGKLAGWLTGLGARGLELAQERPGAELLEVDGAVVRIHTANLTCVPVVTGERVEGLELELRLIAQIEEGDKSGLDRENLKKEIVRQAGERLTAAVEQLQRWNADCIGLGRMAGSARPEHWKKIRSQWEQRFPEVEVSVRCTVALSNLDE